jgi:hypothetical protein
MEPEGSLPCSQEPSTFPYPEPDQSSPYRTILSKIHFNIIRLHITNFILCWGMNIQNNDITPVTS